MGQEKAEKNLHVSFREEKKKKLFFFNPKPSLLVGAFHATEHTLEKKKNCVCHWKERRRRGLAVEPLMVSTAQPEKRKLCPSLRGRGPFTR